MVSVVRQPAGDVDFTRGSGGHRASRKAPSDVCGECLRATAVDIASRIVSSVGGFGIMMQTVLPWFTCPTGSGDRSHRPLVAEQTRRLPSPRSAPRSLMRPNAGRAKGVPEVAANSVSSPDDHLTHVLGVKASVDVALTTESAGVRRAAPSKHLPIESSATPGRGRRQPPDAFTTSTAGRHWPVVLSTELLSRVHTQRGPDLGRHPRLLQDLKARQSVNGFRVLLHHARLVDSLIAGHIDIAWNINLAYYVCDQDGRTKTNQPPA